MATVEKSRKDEDDSQTCSQGPTKQQTATPADCQRETAKELEERARVASDSKMHPHAKQPCTAEVRKTPAGRWAAPRFCEG